MIEKNLFFIHFGDKLPYYTDYCISNYKKINYDFNIQLIHYTINDIQKIVNQKNNDKFKNIKYNFDFLLKWCFTYTLNKIKDKISDSKNYSFLKLLKDDFKYVIINYFGGISLELYTYPNIKFDDKLLCFENFRCQIYYPDSILENKIVNSDFFIGCQKNKCCSSNLKILDNPATSNYNDNNYELFFKLKLKDNDITDKCYVKYFHDYTLDYNSIFDINCPEYYNIFNINIDNYKKITNYVPVHNIQSYNNRLENNLKFGKFNDKYVFCKNIENKSELLKHNIIDLYNTKYGIYNKIIMKYSGFLYLLEYNFICDTDYIMYSNCGWFHKLNLNTSLNKDTVYVCNTDDSIKHVSFYEDTLKISKDLNIKDFVFYLKNCPLKNIFSAIIIHKEKCHQLLSKILENDIIDKLLYLSNKYKPVSTRHFFSCYLTYILYKNFKLNYNINVIIRIYNQIDHCSSI